jgi:hypothetical protein
VVVEQQCRRIGQRLGAVKALAVGETTIRARFNGVTSETKVIVSNDSVMVELTIQPNNNVPYDPAYPDDRALDWIAIATFDSGATIDVSNLASWSITPADVATIVGGKVTVSEGRENDWQCANAFLRVSYQDLNDSRELIRFCT